MKNEKWLGINRACCGLQFDRAEDFALLRDLGRRELQNSACVCDRAIGPRRCSRCGSCADVSNPKGHGRFAFGQGVVVKEVVDRYLVGVGRVPETGYRDNAKCWWVAVVKLRYFVIHRGDVDRFPHRLGWLECFQEAVCTAVDGDLGSVS
jgi:hypothetical protein